MGVITGLIAALRKVWDWFFGHPSQKKRKAKNKAYNEINSSVQRMKDKYNKKTNKELTKMIKDVRRQLDSIDIYLNDLWKASDNINKIIEKLNDIKLNICTELIQTITNKFIDFAYIDFQLNSMVIVSESLNEDEIKKLGITNFYLYANIGELVYSEEIIKSENNLYVKVDNEIIYRALNNFKNKLGIDSVRKKKGAYNA